MSNKSYDILKLVALIAVPAGAFIGAVCTIWQVPHAEQITATLTALDTLLGALVAAMAHYYNQPADMDIDDLEYMEDEEGGEN